MTTAHIALLRAVNLGSHNRVAMAELRAGRRNANGDFETLDGSGDTLFHMFSVPGHGCQPVLPADTNVFARRVPIPLFGAGLVEAPGGRAGQQSHRRALQRPHLPRPVAYHLHQHQDDERRRTDADPR